MNEAEINKIGGFLEHQGFSDEAIDAYLEHHGVKGQKWGVRRQQRIQRQIDQVARVRDGSASKLDKVRVANRNLVFTSKQAGKALERSAKVQKNVADGKTFVRHLMTKGDKKRLSELNFRQGEQVPAVAKKIKDGQRNAQETLKFAGTMAAAVVVGSLAGKAIAKGITA